MEDTGHCDPLMDGGNKSQTLMVIEDNPRELSKRQKIFNHFKQFCRMNKLMVLTICGVIAGIVFGLSLRSADLSPTAISLLSFPGEILMRMLKMLIGPLIVGSLVTGMASLDPINSGKMGLRAIGYYLVTTVLAIVVGIGVTMTIHPGNPSMKEHQGNIHEISTDGKPNPTALDAILDVISFLPTNQDDFKKEYFDKNQTNSTGTLEADSTDKSFHWIKTSSMSDGFNALGVMTFSITFGVFLSISGSQAQQMINFFRILSDMISKMVNLVLWFSPIGIMSLITGKILEVEDMAELGSKLGLLTLTVLTGLAIHSCLVLPGIYFLVTRKNPFRVLAALLPAFSTVIGTCSSSATLPVTFVCLEKTLGVDPRVTRFVLPVGATINMDGTALYEAVVAIFIAQMNGISLDFAKIIIISLTSTLASVGAATIPSAGLVTIVIVLTATGLPLDDINLIFTIDWFLDRCRTCVNVLGDGIGACTVEQLSKKDISKDPHYCHNGLVQSHLTQAKGHVDVEMEDTNVDKFAAVV